MNNKKKSLLIGYILLAVAAAIRAQQDESLRLTGPYLGQKPPGMTPELFAPDVITRIYEVQSCLTISPGGNEIYRVDARIIGKLKPKDPGKQQ